MSTIAITAADIAMYRRYDGDIDGLSRSADRDADVSDAAWRMIDDLRQRAFIVAAGRASKAFAQRYEADLVASIPDATVRSEFRQLVEVDLRTTASRAGR
jgi:hypothetical protein